MPEPLARDSRPPKGGADLLRGEGARLEATEQALPHMHGQVVLHLPASTLVFEKSNST